MRKYRLPLIALLVLSILLAACQSASPSGGQAQPTDIPPVVSPNQIVVDGRVVPADDVQLSFNTGGEVTDIRVKEGDVVKTGDVLASLGNRAQLKSTLSSAKLQLLSAQQDLLTAQQGRQELFDTLPQDRTAALDELTKAKKALDDATKKTYSVSHPARDTDIQDAQASVTLLADKLDKAKDDFEPYDNKHADNLQRAVYLQRLALAQRNYDDAVRRLNNLQSGASDFYRSQTDAEFQIAQERLAQAQKDFDKLTAGPDPDKLALFDSQISTAQGRIDAAQAAITAAEEILERPRPGRHDRRHHCEVGSHRRAAGNTGCTGHPSGGPFEVVRGYRQPD